MIAKNKIGLALVLVLILGLTHCRKKEYVLEEAPSKVEGLHGFWELRSVIQVDETSLAKEEKDLSEFYIDENGGDVMEIYFDSSERSFVVTLGAIGRNYLPDAGSWSFDDENFPEFLFLEDANGNVTALKLQGPTRPQDQVLKFSFQRSCTVNGETKEYVGYRYELNRK